MAFLFGPKKARKWRSTTDEETARERLSSAARGEARGAARDEAHARREAARRWHPQKPYQKPAQRPQLTPEEVARIDSARAEKIRKWEEEQKARGAEKESTKGG